MENIGLGGRCLSARRALFVAGLAAIAVAAWLLVSQPAAQAQGSRADPGVHPVLLPGLKYMGAASCAGAECHGAPEPKLQSGQMIGDENNLWQGNDPHAEAYDSLANELSKKIGGKLGVADAAASERCLSCHALSPPAAQRGEKFNLKDAVSCEACHGPAERWYKPHEQEGWTGKERKRLGAAGLLKEWGLVDTSNLAVRAHTCVACHLRIDKDLLDAGHPPLEFELYGYNYYVSKNTQKEYQRHWEEAEDPLIDARLWAAGQIAAHEAAQAQVKDWQAKGGDAAAAAALEKLYGQGRAIVKQRFGAETAEAVTRANLTADAAAAAAKDWAALAPGAKDQTQRRIVANGLAGLGEATFKGRGAEAPDAFWDAWSAALDAAQDGGAPYQDAIASMGQQIK